ncbi:BTB/POZ domain-containing protein 6-like [Ochlerotatus camptorhynchus]|uniref:BTB/POZ domain-containing protein 6-like n=1 Tax=Ochlerotatus camptorhynchus TaxID=644619 RepID=UPI0031D79385
MPFTCIRRDSSNIKFDVPLAGTLEQLVNNMYQADVLFKVGQCGELIYAHKLIITTASEVFFAQFNWSFAESKRDTLADPVVIEDVEPAPFLELLRYIYCREVDIQPGNMLDIYYASEKYMLRKLSMICEDNLYRLINETSVMKVLQHNRRYKFPVVDTICVRIICDNPLKYFKQEEFLTLSQQALQLIASSSAMNCRIDQLDQAITQWKQSNKKAEIDVQLESLLCRKLYFFDKGSYNSNIDTRFKVGVATNIDLYGVGIYVGIEGDSPPFRDSTITIRVDLNGLFVEETVAVVNTLKIHEIMFEKQLIVGLCEISVKIVKHDCLKEDKMFNLKGLSTTGDSRFTVNSVNQSITNGRVSQINCVAYLLYNWK